MPKGNLRLWQQYSGGTCWKYSCLLCPDYCKSVFVHWCCSYLDCLLHTQGHSKGCPDDHNCLSCCRHNLFKLINSGWYYLLRILQRDSPRRLSSLSNHLQNTRIHYNLGNVGYLYVDLDSCVYFFMQFVFHAVKMATKLIPLYNILAWGIPIAVALPLLALDKLGLYPGWLVCATKPVPNGSPGQNALLLLLGGWLPELISIAFVIILYTIIGIHLCIQVCLYSYIQESYKILNSAWRIFVVYTRTLKLCGSMHHFSQPWYTTQSLATLVVSYIVGVPMAKLHCLYNYINFSHHIFLR